MIRERVFQWNVKVARGPPLSVDVVGCKQVADVKARISNLFPELDAETIRFVPHGSVMRDSDALDGVGVGSSDVVMVQWPAYIEKFHGFALPWRASISDKLEEARSSGDRDKLRRVLKDAADQGHLSGEREYGLFLIEHGDAGEGIVHLKSAADRGDLESVFQYGRYLLEATGEEKLEHGVMYV